MIFMNVDLPDPLAPISPYRLPSPNLTLTFSKRGLGPNWMVRLAVDITVFLSLKAPEDACEETQ
ncbi:hypothetical protein D3C81_2285980 [compost metagenome]